MITAGLYKKPFNGKKQPGMLALCKVTYLYLPIQLVEADQ